MEDGLFEDRKVNIKVILAFFWTALMFIYIYNDILSMYQPGHVSDLFNGHLEGVYFNQSLLLSAAVLMCFPSLMIILSLILKAKVNRVVNISVGIFHILVLVGTQFVGQGKSWYYWRFNEIVEAIIIILIIVRAWKWPKVGPYK